MSLRNRENDFQNSIGKPLGGIGLVCLWVGVLFIPLVEIGTCTQGSEDNWLISFIFYTPISLLFLSMSYMGTKTPSVIRWLSLPLFGLLPWAGYISLKYIWGVSILGNHPCMISTNVVGFNAYTSSWWAVYWGPIQFIFVLLCTWCLFKYWMRPKD